MLESPFTQVKKSSTINIVCLDWHESDSELLPVSSAGSENLISDTSGAAEKSKNSLKTKEWQTQEHWK